MKRYFIQSNDGRFVARSGRNRDYSLTRDVAARCEYGNLTGARLALDDAASQLVRRNGILALAIFETRPQPGTIKWTEVL